MEHDRKLWPFTVLNKDGKPMIEVEVNGETKTFLPEEISAMVLTKVVATCTYLPRRAMHTLYANPGRDAGLPVPSSDAANGRSLPRQKS